MMCKIYKIFLKIYNNADVYSFIISLSLCIPVITCSSLPTTFSGVVGVIPHKLVVGTTLTYACLTGYKRKSGSTALTCQSSGLWDTNDVLACEGTNTYRVVGVIILISIWFNEDSKINANVHCFSKIRYLNINMYHIYMKYVY